MRHRRRGIPKPPKPPKLERPSSKVLREAYQELVSADQRQRIDAFVKILTWYRDKGIPYAMFKVNGALQDPAPKLIERAGKLWLLGNGTDFSGEKETSYRQACVQYQKAVDGLVKVPKIQPWLKLLDEKQPRMEQKQQRLQMKLGRVLELLQAGLAPTTKDGRPIQLRAAHIVEPYKIDPENATLSFRRDMTIKLFKIFRREGMFLAVMNVLDPITRMMASEKEIDGQGVWTGRWLCLPSKQKEAMFTVLGNLAKFGKTPESPKRWVRVPLLPGVVIPNTATGQPSTPRPKPAGGFAAHADRIDGMFTKGSDRGIVYEFLKDGQVHEFSDIHAACPKSNLKGILQVIAEKGAVSGKFRLEVNGSKFQLIVP